jgi:hypothetical protein
MRHINWKWTINGRLIQAAARPSLADPIAPAKPASVVWALCLERPVCWAKMSSFFMLCSQPTNSVTVTLVALGLQIQTAHHIGELAAHLARVQGVAPQRLAKGVRAN